MEKHKTVNVTVGDMSEDIDKFIAPLIKKLWEMGITTINSCENNVPSGFVWIQFLSAIDLENFLDAIAIYSEDMDSMYNRMLNGWSSSEKDEANFWKYNAHPSDFGVETEYCEDGTYEDTFTGKHQFVINVSVRFPRKDVAEIMKNLNKYCESIEN